MSLYTPNRCVILAIDPGKVSGVAILRNGELWNCGITIDDGGVTDWRLGRLDWVRRAYWRARDWRLPLVIAAETWTRHGLSTAALIGLGAEWGEWKNGIKRFPRMKPTIKIVRYRPMAWRQAIFGKRLWTLTREQWDEKTIAYARGQWPSFAEEFDRDSAAAACIGLVASRDEKVGKLPGVRA